MAELMKNICIVGASTLTVSRRPTNWSTLIHISKSIKKKQFGKPVEILI
jgi:hypothetical protein